ncbi:FUZ/MON1/HPS1 first Longin domain-containing protein [Entamoeba marina]
MPLNHTLILIFLNHKNHFFIVSNTGKPIFSKYGDETLISTLLGTFSALVSVAIETGETIEINAEEKNTSYRSERTFYLFLCNYLVSIVMSNQLYIHIHLWDIFENCLKINSAYDLRQIVHDYNFELKTSIYLYDTWLGSMTEALEIQPCPLYPQITEIITELIKEGNEGINNDIILGILLHENKVVSYVSTKGLHLSTNDINSLICCCLQDKYPDGIGFPELSKSGKLQLWVTDIGVMKFCVIFKRPECLLEVKIIAENINSKIDEIYLQIIPSFQTNPQPTIFNNHQLMYFAYISNGMMYSPPLNDMYNSRKEKKRLMRVCSFLCQEIKGKETKSTTTKTVKTIAYSTEKETVAGKNTKKGIMVCIFNLITTATEAISQMKSVEKWIETENMTIKTENI